MTIKIEKWKVLGDCAVLYSDGYLNAVEGERLEDHCALLLEQGLRKFIIDFRETEFINSIGISILISVMDRVRENEGVLLFSGLQRANVDVFNMLGLTKYIPVFETEEEAIRSCINHMQEAIGERQ